MKIKPPAAAGKFYTDNEKKLLEHLNEFEKNNLHDYEYKTRAVIVPHAGYIYSGQLASCGFQYIDKNVKNVFIIAPSHYVIVRDASLSSFDKWATPLGEISLNQEINRELTEKFGCEFQDEAFVDEHSAEVQVPFIQKYLPNVKIIPILTTKSATVTKIIAHYWSNPENAFVISSDLSHFLPSSEARKVDSITAEMIETKNIEELTTKHACGAFGIGGIVKFAKMKNYSLILVGLHNSGDVTGDNSRVVGYGSWILYEGTKNEFIKKYFSPYIIDVCKKSILAGFEKQSPKLDNIPAVFLETGACFVTLEKHENLRGCIGSIIAHRPLIDDLVKNAQNSAFFDSRFQPLKKEEFDELDIDISLLSEPEKMEFENETDLLTQIRKDIDGLIIKERGYQAVYLPSVWEQLPEKELFLDSLKIKAGLPPKYFSSTFEAYRFTTEYIKS